MNEQQLLERIIINPKIFDGKPMIQGHSLAVEQVLEMLATGNTVERLLENYSGLEWEDIQACLLFARQLVIQEQSNPVHHQPKTLNDLIAEIPQIIEQVPYLKLLVLFGSRARGDHDQKSDWDFAFLCDEEMRKQYEKGGWDAYRTWGILQRAYNLGDDQIDVVEIKNCSNLLAHSIAKEGQVIYERNPGEFEAFQKQSQMSKEQLQAIRQQQREKIKAMVQELQK
jgi:uncharacterized protein (DUF433 family)/predicted nucleotidyltransferase